MTTANSPRSQGPRPALPGKTLAARQARRLHRQGRRNLAAHRSRRNPRRTRAAGRPRPESRSRRVSAQSLAPRGAAAIGAATRTRISCAGAGPAAPCRQAALRRTPRPRRGRDHRPHAVPGQRPQERQEAARACAVARGRGRAPPKPTAAISKGFAQGSALAAAPRSCATSPTCLATSARPPTSQRRRRTWPRPTNPCA